MVPTTPLAHGLNVVILFLVHTTNMSYAEHTFSCFFIYSLTTNGFFYVSGDPTTSVKLLADRTARRGNNGISYIVRWQSVDSAPKGPVIPSIGVVIIVSQHTLLKKNIEFLAVAGAIKKDILCVLAFS